MPQNQSDDFDFVVAAATEQQPQPDLQQQQMTATWVSASPEQQVAVQNQYPDGNVPVQQQQNFFNPVEQQPVQPVIPPQQQYVPQQQPEPQNPATEVYKQVEQPAAQPVDIDQQIDQLMDEFWLKDKDEEEKPEEVDDKMKDILEKNKKINKLLTDVTFERDWLKDELWQERYEKQQLEIINEKLQNRIEQLSEANTALKYDENKMDVADPIKDFVVFYDKRMKNKNEESPNSQLTKRTLAEAVKVIEGITNLSMDDYLNEYYARTNPQMPRIWSNHYGVDQLGFDPLKAQKSIEAKKNDPNWNPMVDVF